MAGVEEKPIPPSIRRNPAILMLRDRLADEGEALRLREFHVCQMAGFTRKQTDRALEEFDEKWGDHMQEVLDAECRELMAAVEFIEERERRREEKRKAGREKKDES